VDQHGRRVGKRGCGHERASRLVVGQAQVRCSWTIRWARAPGTAAASARYLDERWLVTDDSGSARASHNTFLTTLVEQGIPGAILYIWLTCWTLLAMCDEAA